jgi:hypothetical protein
MTVLTTLYLSINGIVYDIEMMILVTEYSSVFCTYIVSSSDHNGE